MTEGQRTKRNLAATLALSVLLAAAGGLYAMQKANSEVEKAWFTIEELEKARGQIGRPYLEFLRVSTMSAGLYTLAAGVQDLQRPHGEDEIYYVVSGKGMIRVDDEDKPVGPGSVVFVGARIEHRFHSIEEDLKILVVFAPPSGSRD